MDKTQREIANGLTGRDKYEVLLKVISQLEKSHLLHVNKLIRDITKDRLPKADKNDLLEMLGKDMKHCLNKIELEKLGTSLAKARIEVNTKVLKPRHRGQHHQ